MLYTLILFLSPPDGHTPGTIGFILLPFCFAMTSVQPERKTRGFWFVITLLCASALMWQLSFNRSNSVVFSEIAFLIPLFTWLILLPVLFYIGNLSGRSFPGKTWTTSIWWWIEYLTVFTAVGATFLRMDLLFDGYSVATLKLSAVLLGLYALVFIVIQLKNRALRLTPNKPAKAGAPLMAATEKVADDGTYPHPPFRQERPQ